MSAAGRRPHEYETEDGDRVTVYRDAEYAWRWTRRAANGRVVSDGAEGYARKDSALRAALRTNPRKPRIT